MPVKGADNQQGGTVQFYGRGKNLRYFQNKTLKHSEERPQRINSHRYDAIFFD